MEQVGGGGNLVTLKLKKAKCKGFSEREGNLGTKSQSVQVRKLIWEGQAGKIPPKEKGI